jgi:hypothetical protein
MQELFEKKDQVTQHLQHNTTTAYCRLWKAPSIIPMKRLTPS